MTSGASVLSCSPLWDVPSDAISVIGGPPLSLQMALYRTLTCNPDLNLLRLGNPTTPSAESVEVARHFPTTLNPTLWIDYRPMILIPLEPFGGPGGAAQQGPLSMGATVHLPVPPPTDRAGTSDDAPPSYRPGGLRSAAAGPSSRPSSWRWSRPTASFRRLSTGEKFKIAKDLAEFNEKILTSLRNRLEANLVLPADVILARVESRASRRLAKAAQQNHIIALADLRNQIGITDSTGKVQSPAMSFALPPCIPPVSEQELIEIALQNRPDIHAARSAVAGTKAAENLARADRIPGPIVGPSTKLIAAGLQYIGFVYVTAIPVWNNGGPLQRQHEADHHRAPGVAAGPATGGCPGPVRCRQVERGGRSGQSNSRTVLGPGTHLHSRAWKTSFSRDRPT